MVRHRRVITVVAEREHVDITQDLREAVLLRDHTETPIEDDPRDRLDRSAHVPVVVAIAPRSADANPLTEQLDDDVALRSAAVRLDRGDAALDESEREKAGV